MPRLNPSATATRPIAIALVAAGIVIVLGALLDGVVAVLGLGAFVGLGAWLLVRSTAGVSLTAAELDQLRQAEVALSQAISTHDAARELADHVVSLLNARSAVVLIEGIGDTVRVAAGDRDGDNVYGSGSKMRLLDDAGVPCGSIAVSARADGRRYGPRDERILDALAERVSTTLHQVSLLTTVRAEQRKLDDLISSSSDGIFSVGSDFRVLAWNPAMEAITGVPSRDAVGAHVNDSFQPRDENGVPKWGSHDPGRSRTARTGVLLRLDDEDDAIWVRCSYAPLSDGGYVVIARDESERKKVQDDKDGWIAQVSHELRTPLTPLKGFLQTLSRRDEQLSTTDRQKIYEVMLREQTRLESLVDGLLRSTQLGGGDSPISTAPTDWRAIVEAHVGAVAADQPNRIISTRLPTKVPLVDVDDSLAATVLGSLVSNAVKYTAPGTPFEVEISIDREHRMVRTSVIDHGDGVPRVDRVRIFEKFTRLGDHLTRPQQGVGLGLFIAKQAVQRLGGTIDVHSTKGGGATFSFTLPIASARPSRSNDNFIDLDAPAPSNGAAEVRRRLRANRD